MRVNKLLFLYLYIKALMRFHLYELFPLAYKKFYKRQLFNRAKTLPFYKVFDCFDKIPVITKKIFIENFNQLNTLKLNYKEGLDIGLGQERSRDFVDTNKDFSIILSSGTSGLRGVVITTPKEQIKWVVSLFAHLSWFSIFKSYKIAFFLRSNSAMYENVKQSSKIQFRYFDLAQDFSKNYEDLIKYDPSVLIAPPYILKEIIQLKNHDKNILSNVKIVVSVADVLEDSLLLELRKSFSCPIHQIYQATEGFLGSTCKFEKLHLNEDLLLVEKESIGESGRFSPILTDYFRETQIICRYKLDDILISNGLCDCGSKKMYIEKIEGRSDEILDFDGVKIYPDFLRHIVQNNINQFKDFAIVKNGNLLTVKIEGPREDNIEEGISKDLNKLLSSKNIIDSRVEFEYEFKRDMLTKRKRVFSV